MGLRCVKLQLLKHLGDHIEAGGVVRLDGGGNLRQLSLRRNDEVQVLKVHMRAQDPADAVTSYLRPDVDVETRKKPLPDAPTVGVFGPPTSKLYLRVWLGWYARRTQGFILVRAECPYVQFTAARVTGTWFVVGVTNR